MGKGVCTSPSSFFPLLNRREKLFRNEFIIWTEWVLITYFLTSFDIEEEVLIQKRSSRALASHTAALNHFIVQRFIALFSKIKIGIISRVTPLKL